MQAAEHLARRFHETYERLAPLFGYTTREETRAFDPTTPNGKLMIAVCAEITDAAGLAHAARVLAEFAKTAPGRLPQRVQDAIDAALADGVTVKGASMADELCHCPCCREGIEAPHEYHLERRPMASEARCAGCEYITNEAMRCEPCPMRAVPAYGVGVTTQSVPDGGQP